MIGKGRHMFLAMPFSMVACIVRSERIGMIAFTHAVAHTKDAYDIADSLVQQGFNLPEDDGNPLPSSLQDINKEVPIQRAELEYASSCEQALEDAHQFVYNGPWFTS